MPPAWAPLLPPRSPGAGFSGGKRRRIFSELGDYNPYPGTFPNRYPGIWSGFALSSQPYRNKSSLRGHDTMGEYESVSNYFATGDAGQTIGSTIGALFDSKLFLWGLIGSVGYLAYSSPDVRKALGMSAKRAGSRAYGYAKSKMKKKSSGGARYTLPAGR
jgi:hypothetical protein